MATVHLLAGLPGAGKTTLAERICTERPAVRFTLDEWMLRLHGLRYDDEQYGVKAAIVRELIWDVAQQVLRTGTDVVLDWSQWSRAKRSEWSDRAKQGGWQVLLHYLSTPSDIAIERVSRRAAPFAHAVDAAGIRHMETLFEEPAEDEGLPLVCH